MDMNEIREKYPHCPNCGRHCPIDAVSCPRGQAFVEKLLRGESVDEENFAAGHGEGREHRGHGERGEGREFHGRGERGEKRGFHGRGEPGEGRDFRSRGEHGEGRGRCRREIPDDGSLASLLHQCMHLLRHGEARGMGQGRILTILSQTDEISQRELQEHLGIQPGSLSEILGKLESRGQIHRSRDEQDKRKATLRITDAGRQALEAVSQSEQKDPFAVLSAEEQETLRTLLNKVLNTNK
jgi:DNA-binding MarR family transcriptional regulator